MIMLWYCNEHWINDILTNYGTSHNSDNSVKKFKRNIKESIKKYQVRSEPNFHFPNGTSTLNSIHPFRRTTEKKKKKDRKLSETKRNKKSIDNARNANLLRCVVGSRKRYGTSGKRSGTGSIFRINDLSRNKADVSRH